MENLVRWHRVFLLMSWLILRWHLMIVQAALNSGCSYPNLLSRRDSTFLEFNIYYISSSSYSRNWWASSKGISRPNKYYICTAYQRVRAVLCLSHPLTNRFFPLRLAAAWLLTWSTFASSACDGHDLQPKEFPPETTDRSVSIVGWDFNLTPTENSIN